MKTFREYLNESSFEETKNTFFKGNGYRTQDPDDAIKFIERRFGKNFQLTYIDIPSYFNYGKNITLLNTTQNRKYLITIIKDGNFIDIFWEKIGGWERRRLQGEATSKNTMSIKEIIDEITLRGKK